MNNALQSVIYSIIRKGYNKRKEDCVFPYVTREMDIIQEVSANIKEVLDEMVKDGIIKRTSNINGLRMYVPVNEEMIIESDKI